MDERLGAPWERTCLRYECTVTNFFVQSAHWNSRDAASPSSVGLQVRGVSEYCYGTGHANDSLRRWLFLCCGGRQDDRLVDFDLVLQDNSRGHVDSERKRSTLHRRERRLLNGARELVVVVRNIRSGGKKRKAGKAPCRGRVRRRGLRLGDRYGRRGKARGTRVAPGATSKLAASLQLPLLSQPAREPSFESEPPTPPTTG